jgi:hypothetical protein
VLFVTFVVKCFFMSVAAVPRWIPGSFSQNQQNFGNDLSG